MSKPLIPGLALMALLACSPITTAGITPPEEYWSRCWTYDPDTGEQLIDPLCFFDLLIDRYQGLARYADVAKVTHVTERPGSDPQRVETQIGCEVEDGHLRVDTPVSQLARGVGLDIKLAGSPALDEASMRYNLWLAPHMSLKFTQKPQKEFRPGVEEGFTATEAESVTIDEKPMVHLKLQSGDGQSKDCQAEFDLYVNPDSMLIERIEGQERLPDGASCETTLEITPTHAEGTPTADQPAESAPAGVAPPTPIAPTGGLRPPVG